MTIPVVQEQIEKPRPQVGAGIGQVLRPGLPECPEFFLTRNLDCPLIARVQIRNWLRKFNNQAQHARECVAVLAQRRVIRHDDQPRFWKAQYANRLFHRLGDQLSSRKLRRNLVLYDIFDKRAAKGLRDYFLSIIFVNGAECIVSAVGAAKGKAETLESTNPHNWFQTTSERFHVKDFDLDWSRPQVPVVLPQKELAATRRLCIILAGNHCHLMGRLLLRHTFVHRAQKTTCNNQRSSIAKTRRSQTKTKTRVA